MKPPAYASPGGLTPPWSWAAHTPDSTVDSTSWAFLLYAIPRRVDPPRQAGQHSKRIPANHSRSAGLATLCSPPLITNCDGIVVVRVDRPGPTQSPPGAPVRAGANGDQHDAIRRDRPGCACESVSRCSNHSGVHFVSFPPRLLTEVRRQTAPPVAAPDASCPPLGFRFLRLIPNDADACRSGGRLCLCLLLEWWQN
jgi:hypothetical protein